MRYCAVVLVFVTLLCSAQQQPATDHPDAQQLVTREFGKSFTVDPKFPPMYGDIDGDGEEDVAIIVASAMPMADQVEFKYRTIDPYDAYWGWSDAKDTVQFATTATGPIRYIALIHNWRAPKAKFVVINLPFEKIALSRVMVKKKAVASVHTLESTGLESDLYWDGKKYRWVPGYMNQ